MAVLDPHVSGMLTRITFMLYAQPTSQALLTFERALEVCGATQGPFIVGFDRFSDKMRPNANQPWSSIANDHKTITGLPRETPTLHLQFTHSPSYSFPVLPGYDEFRTWLEYDPGAGLNVRTVSYLSRLIWPLVLEI